MEKKLAKNDIYSLLFIICLFLFFTSIPFSMFIKNDDINILLSSLLRLIFVFVGIFYFNKENKDTNFEFKHNFKIKHLLLLPLLLLTCSNIFVSIIEKDISKINNIQSVIYNGILCLCVALSEEILFRSIVVYYLKKQYSNIKVLFISAIVFSLVHFLNFFSTFNIGTTLAQCGYTLVLGYILATIYLYSDNLIYCVIYHFLFNFINDTIYLSISSNEWNTTFFIVNIIVGIIVLLYSLLFLFKIKKGSDLDVA